ncbi:endonuclease/exonuclease/phosphatase family protein [Paracoccus sp. (in: a-proteobacteria)]|uniref:endonuclease/exonuclease/phosphatase family protein n=1 Tax=Paracoccus sp. TaxID=267 RepID=UPI002AFE4913|nr:endonuclease/exonuclease/phosphatase family protein [Paracoccus sp. (in: a-proteobacteria)]
MLRITSLNVNGIRAAFRKGLANWLQAQQPDIVCLQEIKIQDADLVDELRGRTASRSRKCPMEKKK